MADLVYKVGAEISDFERKMATISSKMQDMGKKMKNIGKSMSTYITLPLVGMGAASIKFASDFDESLNKVDVAFKTSSKQIKDFAKETLKTYGIAEGTALDMAALFGDMATSMGMTVEKAADMSQSMVGLAGDLASFKNMDIKEVMTALNGVFTGETESLKRLGIVMTEANLEAFALSKGIRENIKDMSQAEKVNLRYAYVMEMTSNAQGDFQRTGGGAANQMRIFSESLKELGVQFGQVILPFFTKIITKINGWITGFSNLDERTKKIVIVVAGLAAAIGPLLIALGTLTSVIIPALVAGGTAIASAWLPITAIILGVVAAIKLFNMQQEKMNKQINQVAESGSLEELNKQLIERTKKLEELEKKEAALSASVRTQSRDFTPMDGMAVRTSTTESATELRKESGKLAAEITILKKAIELKQKQEEESNKITDEQLRLQKELEEKYKVNTEAVNKNNEAVRQNLGEIPEKLETIKAASLGITTSLEQPFLSLNKVLESFITISDTVAVRVRESFNQIGVKIKETRDVIIDVGKELSYLATDSLISIAESIGEAFGGGKMKDGLNKFLITLADWAQKFGGMLIAAGVASEAFQKSLAVNPLLAVGAGIALIAAASAVKGALASRPGARDSGGSRGGGGSIGRGENLEGMRGLYGLNVTVTGEIVADGSQLRTVIRNDEVRESY